VHTATSGPRTTLPGIPPHPIHARPTRDARHQRDRMTGPICRSHRAALTGGTPGDASVGAARWAGCYKARSWSKNPVDHHADRRRRASRRSSSADRSPVPRAALGLARAPRSDGHTGAAPTAMPR